MNLCDIWRTRESLNPQPTPFPGTEQRAHSKHPRHPLPPSHMRAMRRIPMIGPPPTSMRETTERIRTITRRARSDRTSDREREVASQSAGQQARKPGSQEARKPASKQAKESKLFFFNVPRSLHLRDGNRQATQAAREETTARDPFVHAWPLSMIALMPHAMTMPATQSSKIRMRQMGKGNRERGGFVHHV